MRSRASRFIPAGDTFQLADTNSNWGYHADREFDFKDAQPFRRSHTSISFELKSGNATNRVTLTFDR